MAWRVARSLDVLLDELNRAAPRRSKVSDGSIGDAAHASRDSDHNPWVNHNGMGIVRARDFTHDPRDGLDCNRLAASLADLLRAGSHPALGSGAYIIWNRRIMSRNNVSQGWRAYSGSNPHTQHLHLSVALSPSGFDSTKAWGVMGKEEEDMPSAQEIADAVWARKIGVINDDPMAAAAMLRQVHFFSRRSRDFSRAVAQELGGKVDEADLNRAIRKVLSRMEEQKP